MEQQEKLMLRDGVLAVGMSIILYTITASTTLFIVPLLFVAPRLQDTKRALVPVVAVMILLVGYNLYQGRGQLDNPAVLGSLMIGMYFPFSLLVGAGIWIWFQERRMLERLLAASLFAAVAGFSLVLWFEGGSESAVQTTDSLQAVFEALVSPLLNSSLPMGQDVKAIFSLVVKIVESAFLPLFMGQFGLSVLMSELLVHRTDWGYQERMAQWQLPVNTVWVFLGAWAAVLTTLLIDVPTVACLAWNIALSVTLLYMVQGAAIAASFVRKKNPQATTTKTFVLLLFLIIIPGLNVIPLVVLPLVGVSETWIRYRVNT